MPQFYRRADVLLVHLKADPLFAITIPSKTQTYLAAGRPVVMAVAGDAADLVRAAGAGICCSSEDPAAIAATIGELHDVTAEQRDQFGRNGEAYHRRNLAFPSQVTHFESVFEATVARARALVV
jgi:glycosyltransferase involved in cell wall biosynthesis